MISAAESGGQSSGQQETGPKKSLERTRAGHVSFQCGRAGPPASLSSGVSPQE